VLQAASSRSENTKLTYATQFNFYVDWAIRYAVDPIMPLSPEVLVSHLEWLKQANYSRATIRLRRTVLCAVDARMRATPTDPRPYSLSQTPLVQNWWKGYCRDVPSKDKRAAFIEREDLRTVLRHMFASKWHRHSPEIYNTRDRAILLLGYLGAFRRSELSAANIGDLTFSSRGLWVRWPKSKGDQEGLGEERCILPQDETELCAVDALERWLALYRGDPLFGGQEVDPLTPLFPSIVSGRIVAKRMPATQIYQRIVHIAKAAGVKMSPHSLRAALATHALQHSDEGEVAFHGRWKSRTTMQPYIRRTRAWTKNVTGKLSLPETPI
jgi:integrase